MERQYNLAYVIGITLVATLGGLLFGYDTAVISGAEKSVEAYLIRPFGLGAFAHGITVSSALIGLSWRSPIRITFLAAWQ